MIYQPLEDSFLLEDQVKRFAKGSVLDMGTGSGILAWAAAKKKSVKKVLATDVQKEVIEYCKEKLANKKISCLHSDLFSKVKKQLFDTIVFNPPYLPAKPRLGDLTLEGGKKGFETVERFLNSAGDYLKENGTILLLISSLTNKQKVEEILTKNLFEFKITAKKHIFFEDLFVYLIQKNKIEQKLRKKGVTEIKYFTKGRRGMLFSGKYRGKKITIKSKLPESKAKGRIANEAKWLKKLNKCRIGPKILFAEKDFFAYHFIDGEFIIPFIENSSKKTIKKVLLDILMQCHKLDKLKINKEEMHHPLKHILIDNQMKPILIDFERTHKVKNPKNVTQFLQFIGSGYIEPMLIRKRIAIKRRVIIKIAQEYRENMNIKPVLGLLQRQ